MFYVFLLHILEFNENQFISKYNITALTHIFWHLKFNTCNWTPCSKVIKLFFLIFWDLGLNYPNKTRYTNPSTYLLELLNALLRLFNKIHHN